MIWLPPTKRLALRRLREAKPKVRELGSEIHRLRRTPALPNLTTPPPLTSPRESISTALDAPVARPTTLLTPSASLDMPARVAPQGKNERLGFYLRSGTIQTLKPLRYERRVARNRAVAWGIISGLLILLSVAFLVNLLRH